MEKSSPCTILSASKFCRSLIFQNNRENGQCDVVKKSEILFIQRLSNASKNFAE